MGRQGHANNKFWRRRGFAAKNDGDVILDFNLVVALLFPHYKDFSRLELIFHGVPLDFSRLWIDL